MLMKTKETIQDIKNICLPDKNFKDYGEYGSIAGYGKFKRSLCEVDERGPSKFRYCGVEPDCKPGSYKYENGVCSVRFTYNVRVNSYYMRLLSLKYSYFEEIYVVVMDIYRHLLFY